MKRLFRAEATVVVYLTADDLDEARGAAHDAIDEEVRDNGITPGWPTVTEAVTPDRIPPAWRNAVPRNTDDGDPELTCMDVMEALAGREGLAEDDG